MLVSHCHHEVCRRHTWCLALVLQTGCNLQKDTDGAEACSELAESKRKKALTQPTHDSAKNVCGIADWLCQASASIFGCSSRLSR